MSWAQQLKRVFDIDVEHCPHCGGNLMINAAIKQSPVITKLLTHIGLPTRAPPRSPARSFDLFITDFHTETLIPFGSAPELTVAFRHGLADNPNFIKSWACHAR